MGIAEFSPRFSLAPLSVPPLFISVICSCLLFIIAQGICNVRRFSSLHFGSTTSDIPLSSCQLSYVAARGNPSESSTRCWTNAMRCSSKHRKTRAGLVSSPQSCTHVSLSHTDSSQRLSATLSAWVQLPNRSTPCAWPCVMAVQGRKQ